MSTTRSSSSLASLASSFGVNLKGMSNNSEALLPTLYPDLMNSTNFLTGLFTIPVTIEGDKKTGEPDRTMTYYEYLTTEQKRTWWSAAIGGATTWFLSLFTNSVPEPDKEVDPFRLTEKQAAVVKVIDKKIVCEVDKKTMVISIEVTDQNPLICATMADSVKVPLQNAITDYRTSKARVDLVYNKNVYEEALDRLRQVSEEYARFADGNQKAFLQSVRQKQSELEDKLTVQRGICRQLASQVQQAEMKVQEDTHRPSPHSRTPRFPSRRQVLAVKRFSWFSSSSPSSPSPPGASTKRVISNPSLA